MVRTHRPLRAGPIALPLKPAKSGRLGSLSLPSLDRSACFACCWSAGWPLPCRDSGGREGAADAGFTSLPAPWALCKEGVEVLQRLGLGIAFQRRPCLSLPTSFSSRGLSSGAAGGISRSGPTEAAPAGCLSPSTLFEASVRIGRRGARSKALEKLCPGPLGAMEFLRWSVSSKGISAFLLLRERGRKKGGGGRGGRNYSTQSHPLTPRRMLRINAALGIQPWTIAGRAIAVSEEVPQSHRIYSLVPRLNEPLLTEVETKS